ncbi:Nucleoside-diphosphate-sugar pyrophosphorylase involved in lipopolysaccharide biosynthesis/translation initiation factor 2B gamma/epsilon subunits (eIF-2Bgamma/eIF-2Bepsilon)-like [Prochlorococcus marinus str. MIT 9321]|uniref:Nucleoside-diphosphate-sugar pyrophosphorylase involved in lipopolysaccharide biosynthesis/translation initiation factor 2B gamma/epsilon subunits (EIF-2Bgamma/eIF-2Bepsilon)-like n=1 Tax=Prochlorococcus marinus str. MIT 9401 TaxID=167551 RepID=A0A0A2B8V7_PROMR|nr:sugar phosphate nucleotidyltransferase [Prochlorococcus marinus]KGG02841.1 Nucleoside-diphosphate-sugar pyrophosphorylase involved in lipopolysaccharide biosynthesis/translation initiation factor 2B gamma/epsilon subunits (eIF-2Bgamma/eIF-2Bepsilon)-like [Prochlorococcus marinus str. MIT 9321]KGG05464.1 Nucleoside-diphosphate-sugar pyrophosphorylase involved in lipopolysaccharide biosynthesis/translation initiation factor 2B gamma/epsilon subunits (eIF-2Bgamma/eIF-2Bepsilon)-like [Prochlorococ
MQLIIPMSGLGQRFQKAGYKIPKPLIEVEGKIIVEHILEMFPGVNKVIFICNKDHLRNPNFKMREKLLKLNVNAKIISIDQHKKGPIHAVLKCLSYIDLDEATIVNYCDFNCIWDYKKFIKHVKNTNCDGCVVTYTGFHPHMVGNTNYAYVKLYKDKIIDIQEKKPFTNNPMSEHASSGTYYFKSGEIMSKYFKKTVDEDLNTKGEYYVSMSYKPMINDNLNLNIFNLDKFMQWGTPEDLEEYKWFSELFKVKNNPSYTKNFKIEGNTLIPCAGLGKRFSREGYLLPKPLIKVSKKPMLIQALNYLPSTNNLQIVFRNSMKGVNSLMKEVKKYYPQSSFYLLDRETNGQAETCTYGAKSLNNDLPLTISACDNGILYNPDNFKKLLKDKSIDIIVWGCKNYPGAKRNPEMYGWIEEKNNLIKKIHVKKIYQDPKLDPIIIGTFTFKKGSFFLSSVNDLMQNGSKVNGEYYVDSSINHAIEMGYKVVYFPVDFYLCWGTPNDLKTYEYWDNCFSSWANHSYKR